MAEDCPHYDALHEVHLVHGLISHFPRKAMFVWPWFKASRRILLASWA